MRPVLAGLCPGALLGSLFPCPPVPRRLDGLLRASFCLQLIQSPVTTPLGLIMLKTTSEELACPREDLSVARKEELRKLLLDQVQAALGLLTGERAARALCRLELPVLVVAAAEPETRTRCGLPGPGAVSRPR